VQRGAALVYHSSGNSLRSTPSSSSHLVVVAQAPGQEDALADEVGDEAVAWLVIDALYGVSHCSDAPVGHHADLVGHGEGFVLVMRHQDGGDRLAP
jgi:hypothetical protein